MRLPKDWQAPPMFWQVCVWHAAAAQLSTRRTRDVQTQGRRSDAAQMPDALLPPSIPNVEDGPAPAL